MPGAEPQRMVGDQSSGTHTPPPPASPLSAIPPRAEGVPLASELTIPPEAKERYSSGALDAALVTKLTFSDLRQMALEDLRWSLLHAKRPGLRHKIDREILLRTDPIPKDGTSDKPVAINIAIVSTEANRQQAEAHGGEIRVVSSTGDSA